MKPVTEPVFNLFLFIDSVDDVIRAVGIVKHQRGGSDEGKIAFLRAAAQDDMPKAQRFLVPAHFSRHDPATGKVRSGEFGYETFAALQINRPLLAIGMFEEAFQAVGAPADPLMCTTCVVDGAIKIEGVIAL